jgi:hypothetical protein
LFWGGFRHPPRPSFAGSARACSEGKKNTAFSHPRSVVVNNHYNTTTNNNNTTVKTRMQAHMYDKQEYLTSASSARAVFAEGGALTFWRGLLPRMTRIIAATFILINVRSRAVGYLEAQRGASVGGEAAEVAAAAAAGAAAGAAE